MLWILLIFYAFIDDRKMYFYNELMEEKLQEHLIWSENSASKRHVLKNDIVFYFVLLLLVLGIITLGNYMLRRYNIPRLYIQLGLYALLFAAALFVYRRYLLEYRYILTDRMMSIDQIVGKKIRNAELFHLSDIVSISEGQWKTRGARKLGSYGRGRYLLLTVQNTGHRYELLISPTPILEEKLLETWKTARK